MAKVGFITWTSQGFNLSAAAPPARNDIARTAATPDRSTSGIRRGSRPVRSRHDHHSANKELSRR